MPRHRYRDRRPVEANAVGNVFGGRGVYIGSVKPNVGHS